MIDNQPNSFYIIIKVNDQINKKYYFWLIYLKKDIY